MKLVNGVAVLSTLAEILAPAHTALLVVDVQNDGCDPEGWFARHGRDISRIRQILPTVERVVEAARRAGVLPVFLEQTTLPSNLSDSPAWLYFKTRDGRTETDYTLDGSWGQRTIDAIQPARDEIVVRKTRPSGFFQTNLHQLLDANGVTSVLVCGTITQGCVLATVLDASFHGYYTVFLSDGVQSFDQELHEVALRFLSSRYDSVTSEHAIEIWNDVAVVGPTSPAKAEWEGRR